MNAQRTAQEVQQKAATEFLFAVFAARRCETEGNFSRNFPTAKRNFGVAATNIYG